MVRIAIVAAVRIKASAKATAIQTTVADTAAIYRDPLAAQTAVAHREPMASETAVAKTVTSAAKPTAGRSGSA
jgi:hypothetical protein